MVETAMRSMPIVSMEPRHQVSGALARRAVGAGVCPFAEGGLDEAFRLPVRAWRIGSRVEVPQPETCATLLEHARAVSPAVVSHHPGDVDAEVAEVGDGGAEEDGDGGAGLVRMDLGEADAGVVVDADVHVVPAGPGRALAAVSGDGVAGLLEAREFLDVQVEQFTGMLPLVAPDRRGRLEGVEPVEPCPAQDPADGGGRDPHGPCNLDPRLVSTVIQMSPNGVQSPSESEEIWY